MHLDRFIFTFAGVVIMGIDSLGLSTTSGELCSISAATSADGLGISWMGLVLALIYIISFSFCFCFCSHSSFLHGRTFFGGVGGGVRSIISFDELTIFVA
jgi:hypothetical protein